jgi:hypothetical protein
MRVSWCAAEYAECSHCGKVDGVAKTLQRILAALTPPITMMTMLPSPKWKPSSGKLYEADCLSVLPQLSAGSVDLIFADPHSISERTTIQNSTIRCGARLLGLVRAMAERTHPRVATGRRVVSLQFAKWNLPLGAFLSRS